MAPIPARLEAAGGAGLPWASRPRTGAGGARHSGAALGAASTGAGAMARCSVRVLALALLAAIAATAPGASAEAGVALRAGAAGPRRSLSIFRTKDEEAAHKQQREALVNEEFKQLEEAEDLAEQAIDAAEKDGDIEEAELQQEALEELEEKVIEVAAAEESEAAHEAAAEEAAARGDLEEAYDEQALAEEAAEEAEMAEEELADAVAAEKELASLSLAERLNPVVLASAVSNYAPQVFTGGAAAVSEARTQLRSGLDTVLGDYPLLATFLEWLSLVLPVAILTGGFALLRRDAQGDFSLRSEVLLFGHMYWAGYYALLAFFTLLAPKEPPLTAFARAQPEQYVAYQVLLLLLFVAYLVLLVSHVIVERTPVAALQLAGGVAVYIHTYLTVAHPAMRAALPPTTKGPFWFVIYAAIFASMTGLIKRERKGKGD